MKPKITPNQAVLLGMLFFLLCASVWALRVPIVNGIPISFNSDEPSHFKVVRYMSENWSLPPYTRDYYESAHPPLSDWFEALYIKIWPAGMQAYALRFFSIAIGLAVLFVVNKTARLLVNEWTAAFATCLAAATPMFVMFSSSVTNDPMAVLISSLALYMIVRGLQDGFTKKQLNILCLLVGAAGIAKYTCLGLVPVAIGAVLYDRRRQSKPWAVAVTSIGASFVLISGWWYARNQVLYGDPFRSKAEAAMHMFTGSAMPSSPAYWGSVIATMTGSTVGVYPGFPDWPLAIYDVITLLIGIMLGVAAIIAMRRHWTPVKVALGAYAALVLVVVLAYQMNHFQAHGRLLYPALIVLVLGIAGWRHIIPPQSRPLASIAALAAMACLTVAVISTSF